MDLTYFLSSAGGTLIYLVALGFGEYMFSLNYKKRGNYAVRRVLSIVAVYGVSIALTFPYYYIDTRYDNVIATNVSAVVLYLLMFAFTMIGNIVCYDEKISSCLISGLAAYACQHIGYSLYSVINIASGFETEMYKSFGYEKGYLISALVQIVCEAAVLVTVYFTVARRSNKISPSNFVKKNVIFVTGTTLTIVLIFNAIGNIYTANELASNIFCKSLLALCCVFILVFYYKMLESGKVANDFDIVMNLNRAEHRRFEQIKENMELISVKCHDIKHFIQDGERRKDINVAELNELVDIYDSTIKTGNEIIDTLIAERNLYCAAHNIRLTVIADASRLDYISVTDMCSLFGNMLENAVEAASGVRDENRRLIDINIRPVAGHVFFSMENSYEDEPVIRDGTPISIKGDDRYHGFGIKSIKLIAEKYEGDYLCAAENGIFKMSILFPIKDNAI